MPTSQEKIETVYLDEEMLVVNKPAGVVVTNENRKGSQESLEDWIGNNYPNRLARNGIVHRLDKGTSGLVVVARSQTALDFLKKQFKQREVKKYYWALVGGNLPEQGRIDMPINRSKSSFGRFKVNEEGKMAITEFKAVKKYEIEGKKYTLVEINLKTGRTHQIRVHMNYLSWSLVGDKTYGGAMSLGLERPFLQAHQITIKRPSDLKEMTFNADLADDLKSFLKKYNA